MSLAPWMPVGRRMRAIIARCHHLLDALRRPYKPELHYMRGPGPKWRAKHPRR